MTDFGIFEGIVVKQILPTIGGSEVVGFEDIFIQRALNYFQKNAKQGDTVELSASIFVVWWHEKKIFDSQSDSGVWGILMEQVSDEKKKMQKNDPQAYDNRLVARTMSNAAFEQWYRDNK